MKTYLDTKVDGVGSETVLLDDVYCGHCGEWGSRRFTLVEARKFLANFKQTLAQAETNHRERLDEERLDEAIADFEQEHIMASVLYGK